MKHQFDKAALKNIRIVTSNQGISVVWTIYNTAKSKTYDLRFTDKTTRFLDDF